MLQANLFQIRALAQVYIFLIEIAKVHIRPKQCDLENENFSFD